MAGSLIDVSTLDRGCGRACTPEERYPPTHLVDEPPPPVLGKDVGKGGSVVRDFGWWRCPPGVRVTMRLAKLGGWLAVVLSLALVARVIATDNAVAIVIVTPALIGGLVAVAGPRNAQLSKRPLFSSA
jgi:hypothetical protein